MNIINKMSNLLHGQDPWLMGIRVLQSEEKSVPETAMKHADSLQVKELDELPAEFHTTWFACVSAPPLRPAWVMDWQSIDEILESLGLNVEKSTQQMAEAVASRPQIVPAAEPAQPTSTSGKNHEPASKPKKPRFSLSKQWSKFNEKESEPPDAVRGKAKNTSNESEISKQHFSSIDQVLEFVGLHEKRA